MLAVPVEYAENASGPLAGLADYSNKLSAVVDVALLECACRDSRKIGEQGGEADRGHSQQHCSVQQEECSLQSVLSFPRPGIHKDMKWEGDA